MSEQKKQMGKWDNVIRYIASTVGFAVAATAALELTDAWPLAGDLVLPLLGCELLLQVYLLRNQHRKAAVVGAVIGAIVLLFSLIHLFVK